MRCRVKVCGVTTVDDAGAAVRAGADAIGVNFYAKSPRHVSEDAAREIFAALPPFVEPVILSVAEPWETALARAARLGRVRLIQRHADVLEPPPSGAGVDWMPAFPVRSAESLRAIASLLERCRLGGFAMPRAVLVDAHVPGEYGGTGQTAPWELLADFAPGVPWILAGGLTPDNVGAAVRRLRPYAVDVASGVESAPGKKDTAKLARFVAAVRSAE